jgi:hypothetical protein
MYHGEDLSEGPREQIAIDRALAISSADLVGFLRALTHDEVSLMRIHLRVVFTLIVILAPVTASFAGDRTPTPDSGVAGVASTMLPPPERRSVVAEVSSPAPDNAERQKMLALLILMLKEGRGAR